MADLLRLTVRVFGDGREDVARRLLEFVDHRLSEGDEYVRGAVSVSFVEHDVSDRTSLRSACRCGRLDSGQIWDAARHLVMPRLGGRREADVSACASRLLPWQRNLRFARGSRCPRGSGAGTQSDCWSNRTTTSAPIEVGCSSCSPTRATF